MNPPPPRFRQSEPSTAAIKGCYSSCDWTSDYLIGVYGPPQPPPPPHPWVTQSEPSTTAIKGLWTSDPKINKSPIRVLANTCVKYYYCWSKGEGVIVLKVLKIWSPNFDLDLWPFDPKINRGLPRIMVNTLWSIIIVGQKQKELLYRNHFSTDRQKDW